MKIDIKFQSLRLFIRVSILSAILLIVSFSFIAGNKEMFISHAQNATITSVKSGNWSDSAVWDAKRIPRSSDIVTMSHNITYDSSSSKVASLTINGGSQLIFDSGKSVTLESMGNIIVNGTLAMKPSSPSNIHTLRFTGANENSFVGGGMGIVDSDDGLWVMEGGKLDIQGSQRTGWVRATNSLSAGNTSVTLDKTPTGWIPGDEVLIVPTAVGSTDAGEIRIISAISGNKVTLNSGLSNSHPTVSLPDGRTLGAEVANLTRNVRIEGMPPLFPFPTSTAQNNSPGRSHIFISNTSPVIHTIKYVAMRYMGQRKFHFKPTEGILGGEGRGSDFVLGRYALHFHMSGENNRGVVVEGVVARDIGSHAFVPHASHGITFRDTVSYNTSDEPYWWDPRPDELLHAPANRTVPNPNATNDTLFDHALAAYVKPDPALGAFRLSAFQLDEGHRNTVRNSAAVGVNGGKESSGFHWPEAAATGDHISGNKWTFENNISHNGKANGIFTWQNTDGEHIVSGFTGYRNLGVGLDHGAYTNGYNYKDLVLFENGEGEVRLHSNSRSDVFQKLNNFKVGASGSFALEVLEAALGGDTATELKNWTITKLGAGNKAVRINDIGDNPHPLDIICWILPGGAELEQSNFDDVSSLPGTIIRVQRRNKTAYQFQNGAFTNIASFATCDSVSPIVSTSTPVPGKPTLTSVPGSHSTPILPTATSVPSSPQSGNQNSNGINQNNNNNNNNQQQSNTLGVSSSSNSSSDLNNDGKTNIFDLSILLRNWNKSGQGDLNSDGKVNIFDLSTLLSNWSK